MGHVEALLNSRLHHRIWEAHTAPELYGKPGELCLGFNQSRGLDPIRP